MATNTSRYALHKLIKLSTSKISSDKLRKKIEKRLNPNYNLEVGFFESAKYSDGKYVAQVAFDNEYGTATIPPRPFFRNAIKDKKEEWLELYKDAQAQTKSTLRALGVIGTIIKDDIATSITDLSDPPNAPSTIKQKGSSNPLIDTGVMRNSVAYEINKKGKK